MAFLEPVMALPRTLTYLRDATPPPACIEYSWVPTGHRNVIRLMATQPSDTQTVLAPSATNLEIYVLTQGSKSIGHCQFPVVGEKQILHAVVAVRETGGIVDLSIYFADATMSAHSIPLQNERRECPTTPAS